MKITAITASYSQTESLPGYSNVRPSISLTAHSRRHVHELIDQALEAAGQPAKYDPVDRYDLYQAHNYLLILPAGVDPVAIDEIGSHERRGYKYLHLQRGCRKPHLLTLAQDLLRQNQQLPPRSRHFELCLLDLTHDGVIPPWLLWQLTHFQCQICGTDTLCSDRKHLGEQSDLCPACHTAELTALDSDAERNDDDNYDLTGIADDDDLDDDLDDDDDQDADHY